MKLKLLLMLVLLPSMVACGGQYSTEAIEGMVVDADSKAPISGVVVTANWETEQGTLGGNIPTGQLWVVESVTDENGRYRIPPRERRWSFDRLDRYSPQLLVFKSGYRYRKLFNDRGSSTGAVRTSEWNGKTIEINKFDGDLKSYGEYVFGLSSLVDQVINVAGRSDKCRWKKVPYMLVELQRVKSELKKNNIKLEGWALGRQIMAIDNIADSDCGRASDFFKEYLAK